MGHRFGEHLGQVSDKVAAAEEEIQKMAEAELPFLRCERSQDLTPLFAEADQVASHVHTVLGETESFLHRKRVEVAKYTEGAGQTVKEEAGHRGSFGGEIQ